MSAFNTVTSNLSCPYCGENQEWSIQYKYGDCWQFNYVVGDIISWGGNDNGKNVGGKVRTDGIAENKCQSCGSEDLEAEVHFNNNKIESVKLRKDPLNLEDYYEKM